MNQTILSPAQVCRSSQFERKMTLRRTNSGFRKPQEITFIDTNMMFNMILRAVQNKTKNSFIIYDFTSQDNQHAFTGENVIRIQDYPDIAEMLLNGPEQAKLIEIQKKLPKPLEDLFSKRMRYYNFIVVNSDKENGFYKLFDGQVKQFFQDNPDIKMDTLLNGGMHKANEKYFSNSIENGLLDNPELQCSPEAKAWKMAITFQNVMKTNKIKELHFYKDDCKLFFKKYPYMKNYLSKLTHSTTLVYPNEVFFGRFYYGSWKHASSEEIFKDTQITHVLNMTQEVENYFENNSQLDVNYCRISIEDLDCVNISQYFERGYRFLTEALENPKNKVFVHCAQGKSRSATLVCIFFMRMYGWTFDQTIKYVSDRRDIACPNPGFTDQLREFEAKGFLFDGEDICLKRNNSNNYLHIVSDLADDVKIIHENEDDEEDSDSTSSDEEEYFEEGGLQDQLYKEVQIRYSERMSELAFSNDNTPINTLFKDNTKQFNQNTSKEDNCRAYQENQSSGDQIQNEILIK